MNQCQYQRVGGHEGAWEYQCAICGHVWVANEPDSTRLHRMCPPGGGGNPQKTISYSVSSSRSGCSKTKATNAPDDDPKCTCQIREATRRWLEAGKPNPDQALTSARLATCQACEHWPKYNGLAMTIGLPTLHCPLSKWPGYAPCSAAIEPIRTETLLAGTPLRTAAEIDRLAKICKQCPEFGDGRIIVKLKFPTFVCPRQRF